MKADKTTSLVVNARSFKSANAFASDLRMSAYIQQTLVITMSSLQRTGFAISDNSLKAELSCSQCTVVERDHETLQIKAGSPFLRRTRFDSEEFGDTTQATLLISAAPSCYCSLNYRLNETVRSLVTFVID